MKAYIKIKELRIKHNLTQTELAKKSHISQSYLSELEHNKKSPTLRQLGKIAEALEVHPTELFYFK
ncbi:helix-turn-helix domain-containing protein [Clostridium sp. DL1XJH146]